MTMDDLPAHWRAALLDIAANRVCLWVGVACLPGGERTVNQLEAFGAAERLPSDPRYATLTPWGAALLGVEPYEWDDDRDPVWMPCAVVAEDERIGGRPFTSSGIAGHHRRAMDRFADATGREWFADGDAAENTAPPEPIRDDYDNELALFGGVLLYREEDLKRQNRAEAKARRKAEKAAKQARRRIAG